MSLLATLARGIAASSSRAASSASASTAVPAAMELLGSSCRALASQQAAGMSMALRHFTASRGLGSSLSAVLKEELSYEKQQYQKPEQIAGGPPAPFKLTDTPGDTLLTLTRAGLADEEIAVDLHVNAQVRVA